MVSIEEMIPTLTETEIPTIRISGRDQTPETEIMEEDLSPMILSETGITDIPTLKDSLSPMKTNQLSSQ